MPLQLHIADDVGTQRPGAVGQRRTAKAGMKLTRDRRPSRLLAAFEHKRFESGFGEVEGGNQSIVPAADDDNVATLRHGRALLSLSEFRAPPGVRWRP